MNAMTTPPAPLIAPPEITGKLTGRPDRMRQRDEWMREAHSRGYRANEIAAAVGIRASVIEVRLRSIGCGRGRVNSVNYIRQNGVASGNVFRAIGAMTPFGRGTLANAAARAGRPMADVLAQFYDRHHQPEQDDQP